MDAWRVYKGRTQRGGGGEFPPPPPPENVQSKNKTNYTQILDFLIVLSVNQNIMQLK